ncbi:hypothetical protein NDU88_005062 [Pleurodeles waltl]|uniref:Uncharacterized protein n=1 Tax=Pleurodeles waltl TaxID=8319 RepID=A0AAV7WWJ3_PLEWA|nr:hypothetical protein NDU88_005062 [Pleurodeles waltl]
MRHCFKVGQELYGSYDDIWCDVARPRGGHEARLRRPGCRGDVGDGLRWENPASDSARPEREYRARFGRKKGATAKRSDGSRWRCCPLQGVASAPIGRAGSTELGMEMVNGGGGLDAAHRKHMNDRVLGGVGHRQSHLVRRVPGGECGIPLVCQLGKEQAEHYGCDAVVSDKSLVT